LAVFPRPVSLRSEKEPELQWHVESREAGIAINPRARNVVYSILRLLDDVQNLFNARLSTVFNLQSGASRKAAVVDGKDESVEEASVPAVERDVKEDAVLVRCGHQLTFFDVVSSRFGSRTGVFAALAGNVLRDSAVFLSAHNARRLPAFDDDEMSGAAISIHDARGRSRLLGRHAARAGSGFDRSFSHSLLILTSVAARDSVGPTSFAFTRAAGSACHERSGAPVAATEEFTPTSQLQPA
jgi:hypothetical protein